MALDEVIFKIVDEAGDIGITAQQISRMLGKRRQTVSHYLWILKKTGKITNVERNLWLSNRNRKTGEETNSWIKL